MKRNRTRKNFKEEKKLTDRHDLNFVSKFGSFPFRALLTDRPNPNFEKSFGVANTQPTVHQLPARKVEPRKKHQIIVLMIILLVKRVYLDFEMFLVFNF